MFQDVPGLPILLIAAALVPAGLLWHRGRALRRHVDDPALPERLFAEQRRGTSTMVIVFAALVVASPASFYWTLPLLIIGYLVASYPLRKALYDETWTLAGYLSFVGRIVLGVWGFWVVLAALPFVAPSAGRYDWLAAGVLAAVLLVWNARYADIFRALLRTRPLEDGALLERFAVLVARSSIPAPRFEWIPLAGGAISNAFALPSKRSSVLFTETLLAHMETDEVTAICAHEIAHLEHHTPRLLRRLDVVNVLAIAAAAALSVLPRLAGWESSLLSSGVWLVILVAVIAWRARDRQKNETASDVRAVTLCGNADALVRGLTKLYTFARMPRRLDAETERQATHPSLARRIRDIRAAAGSAPAALGEASTFAAADGSRTVTFDADRLHWTEGEVATHSLTYSQFSELRLRVSSGGATSLVAVERGGRKWQIALAPDDVARLQAVLDIVDGRLADPPGAPGVFHNVERFVAGFVTALALTLGQFAMAVAALVALLQPSASLFAAAGVAGMSAAALVLQRYAAASWEVRLGFAGVLAACAAALLAAAYARRRDEMPRRAWIGVAILAICATFWAGVLLASGLHPVQLHQSARAIPSAAVFLLALGAALGCLPGRAARYASVPVAVAGLFALAAGSSWFLERFGRDPFLGAAQPFRWAIVSGTLRGELTVPFYASTVELSPGGRAVIVTSVRDDEGTPEFYVGRPGGRAVRVIADGVVFLDDDHVAAFETTAGGTLVRGVTVDAPDKVEWQHPLPRVSHGSLSFRPATRTWTLVGVDAEGGVVQVEGTPGAEGLRERHWPPLGAGRVPHFMAVSGEAALVLETAYEPSLLQRGGFWQLALLLPRGRIESRFSRLANGARAEVAVTRFSSQCVNGAVDGDALTCSVFDGTRTRFVSIDAATGTVTPTAWLPGAFVWYVTSSGGWLSGWSEAQPVAIRPSTREGLRMAPGSGRLTHLVATDHMLAAADLVRGESRIRIYELDTDARRAAR